MLILDEPTAGQDAEGRALIGRALEVQRARGGAAVITHDVPFAQAHCGQLVTLAGGKVSNIRSYRA
jgi:energy-coupling factor transport system ATP-binding protein